VIIVLNRILTRLVAFIGLVLVGCALLGFPTMWLWNWVLVDLFHVPRIGFWQAVGVCMLARFVNGSK
jgi:hypothetical protein